VGHPFDVGDERDALPGAEVLDASLEVLPQGPGREAVEVGDDDDASDAAFGRGPLQRRKQDVGWAGVCP